MGCKAVKTRSELKPGSGRGLKTLLHVEHDWRCAVVSTRWHVLHIHLQEQSEAQMSQHLRCVCLKQICPIRQLPASQRAIVVQHRLQHFSKVSTNEVAYQVGCWSWLCVNGKIIGVCHRPEEDGVGDRKSQDHGQAPNPKYHLLAIRHNFSNAVCQA